MLIGVLCEPHYGWRDDDLVTAARRVESWGAAAFLRSDHLVARTPGGHPPTDAWMTMAVVARETATVAVGVLASPVMIRHPHQLLVAARQLHALSCGRAVLGLGAGWSEREHIALGAPFPPLAERLVALERVTATIDEQLDPDDFGRPRVVVAGRSTAAGVAAQRHADEWNLAFVTPTTVADARARVHARSRSIRPFEVSVVVGFRDDGDGTIRTRRDLDRYEDSGTDRLYIQVRTVGDLERAEELVASTLDG